jgi:hypothetical protein
MEVKRGSLGANDHVLQGCIAQGVLHRDGFSCRKAGLTLKILLLGVYNLVPLCNM